MTQVVKLPPDRGLLPDGSKLGGWWHDSDQPGRIVCNLCPRECSLSEQDRGFCFVRQNRDCQIVLTTYGRSTGFCIDPIEKKPLNHFFPGTAVLSFGTAGCNLGCKFCQNHDISKARKVELLSEVATPETIARAAKQLGCHSVAYTYNDPVVWAEYAIDTARACRAVGLKSVAVTAGYLSAEARAPFFEYFDAVNVDLKGFTEAFYQGLTLSHLRPVLETLQWLKKETDVWLEITNLVIPRANDAPDEIRRMCEWILAHVGDQTPVHFTAFHPDFNLTDRPNTPLETLLAAYETARQAGLKYVYVGNVNDPCHQSTYCAGCGRMVIERDWYQLGAYDLDGDRCGHCGNRVPGHFAAHAGNWGPKRQPVQIARFAESQTKTPSTVQSEVAGGGEKMAQVHTGVTSDSEHDDRPELDQAHEQLIHGAASEIVAATVSGRQVSLTDPDLGGVADKLVLGAYVTITRRGRLRSCCGFLGRPTRLADALLASATKSATEDVRLPTISPTELPYLSLETWLLYGMRPIQAEGDQRKDHVTIGRHGLQIVSGNRRGLLLPGVATDHSLDAEGFLRQVCLKAGLLPNAWKEEACRLCTFEGHAIHGDLVDQAAGAKPPVPMFTDEQFATLLQFCRDNIASILRDAVPNYYVPSCPDGMINGAAIRLRRSGGSNLLQTIKFSFRPGVPMQGSLFSLADEVAKTLQAQGVDEWALAEMETDLTLLDDPAMHGTVAEPDLRGLETRQRALMVVDRNKSAWIFDPQREAQDLLDDAARQSQVTTPKEASIFSLRSQSSAMSVGQARVPEPQAGPNVRLPAVAGTFYPADARQLAHEVDRLLPQDATEKKPWPAVLVPHAGLKYSGRIAASTFARVDIPDTVIVLGPKHTALGVDWAVAPHAVWSLPGTQVNGDPDLGQQLAEAIGNLQLDALAHRDEHAIEVELPFLSHFAPRARVVGIVVGSGDLDLCREFAAGLATVLRERDDRVLLVISSDMNHFASDTETRRMDEMALATIQSLDPAAAYDTVKKHHISMCGLLPAVIVMETLRRLERLKSCQQVAYATTADTTGDASRVVGYSGLLFG